MVKVVLYIEGGGERGQAAKDLPIQMRRAFKKFLSKAGIPEGRFLVVRCGSRNQAYHDFCKALSGVSGTHDVPLLLVDSESEVSANNAWAHLKQRDDWDQPSGSEDQHAHLMVQCMENWFLADKQAVANYYGNGFQQSALPNTQPIEHAIKKDLLDGLANASRNTTKKEYSKGNHAFSILERLDPKKVMQSSPWACRLLVTLEEILNVPKRNREWTCTPVRLGIHPPNATAA
ncbi:MAG: DUF4276 family protein [Magnetococcales bacterium]|nr:DUF4276 family protein [Magnetococcales bacterium]